MVSSLQDEYTVDEMRAVIFQCTATGIPLPMLYWFNGSMPLNGTSPRVSLGFLEVQNLSFPVVIQNLTIENTSAEDSGMYSCIAENEVINDTADFELIVRSECICTIH